MYLKSLTLRGFKSFASATALRLEPGITCVVGPNGSGKSNVADALAWVMGEQGAKSLRGGKMEDVIFAGTSGRPPLGRAEVSLTIDNTDGALPIEYAEVTISRTMFRSGGSEYAINGQGCRLLDIQELLSDSGIGREMHVIVGQGQLDAVLHATPEDRRAFIEEAAGVLKHRRRKEKALRKLNAMEANLTRLADLSSEIRRQLKPLGRQAEVARRAQVVQADLRDARARLLADDLVQLQSRIEADAADQSAARQRKQQVEQLLAERAEELAGQEGALAQAAPTLAAAQDTWYRLAGLRERLAGTASLAADRQRLLTEARTERAPGTDPEELEARARSAQQAEQELAERVAAAQQVLDAAVADRAGAEEQESAEQRRLAALVRAAADRREGLARLSGQVAARRSRLEAGQEETARLAAAITEAEQRAEAAQREFLTLESQVAGAEAGERDLDLEHEQAAAELAETDADLARSRAHERDAEQERATWSARREALALGLRRKDGAAALLGDQADDGPPTDGGQDGVIGPLAGALTVRPGWENALAAALGALADGVLVSGSGPAEQALVRLRESDAGRAALLVVGGPPTAGPTTPTARDEEAHPAGLPAGAQPAADLVTAQPEVMAALQHALAGVVVTADLPAARQVVAADPALTAVTADGDVVTAVSMEGGSPSSASALEVQAAVDEATDREQAARAALEQARFALAGAQARRAAAAERVEAALAALHDSDARLAGVAEQLGQLSSAARAARAEAERQRVALAGLQEAVGRDGAELQELAGRLAAAEQAPAEAGDGEPSTAERDRLAQASAAARAAELEARLALRTLEERARATSGRAAALRSAAAQERTARARAAAAEQRRERQARTAGAVLAAARYALDRLAVSVELAEVAREQATARRAELESGLAALRGQVAELGQEAGRLTDSVHRDEVARAEQRLRLDGLRERALSELGLDPQVLVEEYGPHQDVPPTDRPGPDQPGPAARPYVRVEQEKRLRAAEKALALLGTVNPLALEEFAALEERHTFLTQQLADLKASRTDLLEIVKDVDERVEQVFSQAFQDTAEQFVGVFARLFPGGEGRLVLTDPDDMLTSGIEVEARPPGKKVKRLSLLSGGERSLTAVALLVAIFKARPSPFYVMDEVEAALDDTNLGRLLTIFEELRESSQLIVITHQKRTMEIADALYGVTMRGDGVTTVVSQRLREDQPA